MIPSAAAAARPRPGAPVHRPRPGPRTGLLIALLLALPAAFGGTAAPAALEAPRFHRLPLNGALSQNTVFDMVQDHSGLMWFATGGGLDRYDGYRFRAVSSDPRDPDALSGVVVSRLMVDQSGAIWVAGAGDGRGWLDRYDPLTGRVDHLPTQLFGQPSLPGSQRVGLHQGRDGMVWIGTNLGLHRFDPATGAIDYRVDAEDGRTPFGGVAEIIDADDGLWIGSTGGLHHFDPASGNHRRVEFDGDDIGPDWRAVRRLLQDSRGTLWIGTAEGLVRMDPHSGQSERLLPAPGSGDAHRPAGRIVMDIVEDRHGAVWVAFHDGGLSRHVDGRFENFHSQPGDPDSLSTNNVWSLYEDASGLLWIGTAGAGLNQLNPSTHRFQALRAQPGRRDSLSHPFVWDLQQDALGRIWLATLHGLERYDPNGGRYALFTPAGAHEPMQALHYDQTGALWVGAVDGTLYRFDTDRGRFQALWRDAGAESGDRRIWYLGPARGGRIWMATARGLFRISPDTATVETVIEPSERIPMGISAIRCSLIDSDGVQWFGGAAAGLIRYDEHGGVTAVLGREKDNPQSLSSNRVRSLYESPDGTLWVGTHNGLNRMSAEDRRRARNRFRLYTVADGLPNNTVYGILPDPDGEHLWLSTNAGLSRLHMDSGQFTNYTVADGLAADEMNGGAELVADDGRLYFGGVGGVSIVDPRSLPHNDYVPPVRITEVRRPDAHGRVASVPAAMTDGLIDLEPGDTALSVEFAAMDFHQPLKNQFRYRLLGPDGGDWIQTAENDVSFATLPPGRHRLEVMGSNNDGVWSRVPAVLTLNVAYPWWQSPPALLAWLLAVAGLLLAYHRAQQRKLARERAFNEMLQQKESLAEANHQLAMHYARVDALTQLPNRTALLDDLATSIRVARDRGIGFSLFVVNLDGFNKVNSRVGFAIGDRILRACAQRLERVAGNDGLVARIGSDEFAIRLTEAGAADRLLWRERVAGEILAALAQPQDFGDPPIVLSASIGMTGYDSGPETPTELLSQADAAMQAAKQAGGGGAQHYQAAPHRAARENLAIEARIVTALERGEFALWYQPVVDLNRGRLCGFEALIRWFPPDAEPIYPDRFIPIAEESGRIVDIGRWVIDAACAQAARWQPLGLGEARIAINVSMRQLRSGTLLADLQQATRRHEVPASALKLEVTESAMMENLSDAVAQLQQIRKLGAQISIDDFGTGFSSLGHLKRLPVDEVKIDRSFVSDLCTSAQSRKIVASVIRLAHELQLGVVGEGVEDDLTLETLRALGCDQVQGYYFARPLPAEELTEAGWLHGAVPVQRRAL